MSCSTEFLQLNEARLDFLAGSIGFFDAVHRHHERIARQLIGRNRCWPWQIMMRAIRRRDIARMLASVPTGHDPPAGWSISGSLQHYADRTSP
jgi:hypothetical protein